MGRWLNICLSLLIGAAGGWLASLAGVPLPWLLGAIVANAVWIMAFRRDTSRIEMPQPVSLVVISVIGVSIGGMFSPGLVASVLTWWPGILGMILFTIIGQLGAFVIYRRVAGLDRATAYFSASPGGFIENIAMGEENGGDVAMITLLQFLRVLAILFLVPLGFSLWAGQAVGSAAAGAMDSSAGEPAGLWDWALMAVAAAIGLVAGHLLRIPAAPIIGPVLASGALHLTGVLTAQPDAILLIGAQVVLGSSLGCRFSGLALGMLVSASVGCGLAVAWYCVLCLAFAFGLHALTGEEISHYVMSFAPAGVIEMSLVAITLDTNPVFVTTHHVVRIIATVLVTPIFYFRWLAKR